jgi:hypothetical protein
MRTLPLVLLLPLAGCSFGLELLVDEDEPRGGGGDTSVDGDADTDTDSDTDTDADSDTDTDTDADSDTDSDTDPDTDTDADLLRVSSVSPAYGTTAGGAEVVITGGPFDNTAAIRFGTAVATRISVSSNEIVVTTPRQSAEGQVDVSVETSSGSGTLTSGFTYYEDGTGKVGIVGSMDWFHTVGTYWSSTPTDTGSALFFLSVPATLQYWELFAPTLDSCRSEYSYSGSISYYEPALANAALSIPTGGTLTLPWDAAQGAFYDPVINSAQFVQGGTYDLQSMTPDGFPTFAVPDVLTVPSSFTVTGPNIAGSTPPNITRSAFNISWTGSGGDAIVLYLGKRDSTGATPWDELVTCAVRDDGSFTVPSSTFSSWTTGRYVDIVVGRMKLPTGTIPYNNADSGFAGIYWVWGLGRMQ